MGSSTRRGRVGKQISSTLNTTCKIGVVVRVGNTHPSGRGMNGTIWDSDEPGPSLTTNKGEGYKVTSMGYKNKVWYEPKQCYISIRRLTPKECFRLQGWTDDYFERAAFVNFDSQLYKQAGNGVTVSVIQAIAERM